MSAILRLTLSGIIVGVVVALAPCIPFEILLLGLALVVLPGLIIDVRDTIRS